MRSLFFMVLAISMGATLMLPRPAQAYAYTIYYGVFQHPYESFAYFSRMSNGVYERQDNAYISAYTQAIFSENFGYPPVEGEDWTFELSDSETNQLLGYISYYYSGGCLYVDVDGSHRILGCLADPSGDYSFHFIGTFATQCLETKAYHITASHAGVKAPNDNFEPTRFQPAQGEIVNGSLISIPPTLPGTNAATTTISVLVKDNLGCNVPLADIPISVKNTIVPQSGSHKHFSSDTEIGTGEYVVSLPPWTSSSDNNTNIGAVTDQEGLFTANYQAGILGVKENVKVTVTNPDTAEKLETIGKLEIKIPGLVPLEGGLYIVKGSYTSSCDIQHNDGPTARRSNYLTPGTLVNVESIANDYNIRFGRRLSFNDASLEFGGFFDNGSRTNRCHKSHRVGIDIDLNSVDQDGKNVRTDEIGVNGRSQPTLSFIKTMVEANEGCQIRENGEPPPIHFRFFSKQGCL